MGITIGFIALFISIVLPGIIFQRFYYFGEFYKQFTTAVPPLNTFVYALIPGLIIQITCLYVYHTLFNPEFNRSVVFSIFEDFFDSSTETVKATESFLERDFSAFIIYTVCIYVISMLAGFLLSRLVRILQLDIRWKLFRFRNQWSYIFSGEVYYFEKFKRTNGAMNQPNLKEDRVDMVYADILVGSNDGDQLYSGVIVDYDLTSEDISKLDKVYLMNAKRYSKSALSTNTEGGEALTVERGIAGDLFVLPLDKLVNINLSYVTSPKEKRVPLWQRKSVKWLLKKSVGIFINGIVILSIYPIFIDPEWIPIYGARDYGIFQKIVAFLTFSQFIWIFKPLEDEKGQLRFRNDWMRKVGLFVILLVIFIFTNTNWII